jgi:hypothetical protein
MGEETKEREKSKKNPSLFAQSSGEFTIDQSKVYKKIARQPRLAKNASLSPFS